MCQTGKLRTVTPEALPMSSSVRGIPCPLALACWANGDSHAQYVCIATAVALAVFCSRSLSTDIIEQYFAQLNRTLGYKANPQQIELHLRRLDLQHLLKTDPCNIFHSIQSRRQYREHPLQSGTSGWYGDKAMHTAESVSVMQNKTAKHADHKAEGKEAPIRLLHKRKL